MSSKKEQIAFIFQEAKIAFETGVRFRGSRDYFRGRLSGLRAAHFYLVKGDHDPVLSNLEDKLIKLGDQVVDLADIKDNKEALQEYYNTLEPRL